MPGTLRPWFWPMTAALVLNVSFLPAPEYRGTPSHPQSSYRMATADAQPSQEGRRVANAIGGLPKLDTIAQEARANAGLPPSSEDIRVAIIRRLKANKHVDYTFIRVAVTNGLVYLSGSVYSPIEKRLVVENAWVDGVRFVEATDLRVQPKPLKMQNALAGNTNDLTKDILSAD